MKSLLFTLGLGLCCVVQANWEEVTETSEKNMGLWVSHVVACNSEHHVEHLRHMPMLAAELSKPQKDVYSILVHVPMPDGCKKVTYQFRKGEDGKYRSVSDDTTVTVESVKALGEYVMSVINVGNEFRTATLHSRRLTQDPEIIQKFSKECQMLGFTEDQIVVLNPNVKCQ